MRILTIPSFETEFIAQFAPVLKGHEVHTMTPQEFQKGSSEEINKKYDVILIDLKESDRILNEVKEDLRKQNPHYHY